MCVSLCVQDAKRVRCLAHILDEYSEKHGPLARAIVFCSTRNEATLVQNHPLINAR